MVICLVLVDVLGRGSPLSYRVLYGPFTDVLYQCFHSNYMYTVYDVYSDTVHTTHGSTARTVTVQLE